MPVGGTKPHDYSRAAVVQGLTLEAGITLSWGSDDSWIGLLGVSFVELVGSYSGVVWSWLPVMLVLKPVGRVSGAYQIHPLFVPSFVCLMYATKWSAVGYALNQGQIWHPFFDGHHNASWGQLILVPGLWLLSWSCVPSQHWLLLTSGLGPPNGSYNVSWNQLPLVPGLGSLNKWYRVHWGQLLLVWGFRTFERF